MFKALLPDFQSTTPPRNQSRITKEIFTTAVRATKGFVFRKSIYSLLFALWYALFYLLFSRSRHARNQTTHGKRGTEACSHWRICLPLFHPGSFPVWGGDEVRLLKNVKWPQKLLHTRHNVKEMAGYRITRPNELHSQLTTIYITHVFRTCPSYRIPIPRTDIEYQERIVTRIPPIYIFVEKERHQIH